MTKIVVQCPVCGRRDTMDEDEYSIGQPVTCTCPSQAVMKMAWREVSGW